MSTNHLYFHWWNWCNWCKIVLIVFTFLNIFNQISSQSTKEGEQFEPQVTARCERGVMNVVISTFQPYFGVVHTRDFRKKPCLVYGDGSLNTTISINLMAKPNDESYCGIHKLKGSEERTVALAVRAHKTLELSDDKYFLITCAQSGFRNARNEFSKVSLRFLDKGQKVTRLVHGNQYTFRAEISSPDDVFGLFVRNCYSFMANTSEVELIDANGCPIINLISPFVYNETNYSEAIIYSMFKFPDGNKIHVQCDVILCKGGCPQPQCDSKGSKPNLDLGKEGIIQLLASTTAFVAEPGEEIVALANLNECTEWRFPWLIALCICLAILLLIMLLLNIFLCSSLSCSCFKTEVVEKEPSDIEEYDPYKVDWSPNSYYGSRSSLNKHGYTSGGSTRSFSGNESDNYIRPQSRYSGHSSRHSGHDNESHPHHHHNNFHNTHYKY